MTERSILYQLMHTDLPNLTYQKRLQYRTNLDEVSELYTIINKHIFDDQLSMPLINIKSHCRRFWGKCFGDTKIVPGTNSYCDLLLLDKWYCKQWLIMILAHEMVHQYQWDILGRIRKEQNKNPVINHGPSFFIFKERFHEHNIPLKKYYKTKHWFKYQNPFKC
jgi:hypothetical protein